jgi:hypothetical protein
MTVGDSLSCTTRCPIMLTIGCFTESASCQPHELTFLDGYCNPLVSEYGWDAVGDKTTPVLPHNFVDEKSAWISHLNPSITRSALSRNVSEKPQRL